MVKTDVFDKVIAGAPGGRGSTHGVQFIHLMQSQTVLAGRPVSEYKGAD